MRSLIACLFVLFAVGVQAQDDPKDKGNAEKLVGTWQLVKSDQEVPEDLKFFVDLTADGKMTVRVEMKGSKEGLTMKGKYKVNGNKIDYTITTPDGEKKQEILTIKKLTDTELVTVDPEGIKEEFKRVKGEKKSEPKPVKD